MSEYVKVCIKSLQKVSLLIVHLDQIIVTADSQSSINPNHNPLTNSDL
jgi:hypothetical protein